MIDPVRQEVIALAHTVVVKVGTNVLADTDGTLAPGRLQALADQAERIRQSGRKVALVSSGAIGAGLGRLGLAKRPTDLRHLQVIRPIQSRQVTWTALKLERRHQRRRIESGSIAVAGH